MADDNYIIDPDTWKIDGESIRLQGMGSQESSSPIDRLNTDKGRADAAAAKKMFKLDELETTVNPVTQDKFGRTVGGITLSQGDTDIDAGLVLADTDKASILLEYGSHSDPEVAELYKHYYSKVAPYQYGMQIEPLTDEEYAEVAESKAIFERTYAEYEAGKVPYEVFKRSMFNHYKDQDKVARFHSMNKWAVPMPTKQDGTLKSAFALAGQDPAFRADYNEVVANGKYQAVATPWRDKGFWDKLSLGWRMFGDLSNAMEVDELWDAREHGKDYDTGLDLETIYGDAPEAYYPAIKAEYEQHGDMAALIKQEQLLDDLADGEAFDSMGIGAQMLYGMGGFLLSPTTYVAGGFIGKGMKAWQMSQKGAAMGAAMSRQAAGTMWTKSNMVHQAELLSAWTVAGAAEGFVVNSPRLAADHTYNSKDYLLDVMMDAGFGAVIGGVVEWAAKPLYHKYTDKKAFAESKNKTLQDKQKKIDENRKVKENKEEPVQLDPTKGKVVGQVNFDTSMLNPTMGGGVYSDAGIEYNVPTPQQQQQHAVDTEVQVLSEAAEQTTETVPTEKSVDKVADSLREVEAPQQTVPTFRQHLAALREPAPEKGPVPVKQEGHVRKFQETWYPRETALEAATAEVNGLTDDLKAKTKKFTNAKKQLKDGTYKIAEGETERSVISGMQREVSSAKQALNEARARRIDIKKDIRNHKPKAGKMRDSNFSVSRVSKDAFQKAQKNIRDRFGDRGKQNPQIIKMLVNQNKLNHAMYGDPARTDVVEQMNAHVLKIASAYQHNTPLGESINDEVDRIIWNQSQFKTMPVFQEMLNTTAPGSGSVKVEAYTNYLKGLGVWDGQDHVPVEIEDMMSTIQQLSRNLADQTDLTKQMSDNDFKNVSQAATQLERYLEDIMVLNKRAKEHGGEYLAKVEDLNGWVMMRLEQLEGSSSSNYVDPNNPKAMTKAEREAELMPTYEGWTRDELQILARKRKETDPSMRISGTKDVLIHRLQKNWRDTKLSRKLPVDPTESRLTVAEIEEWMVHADYKPGTADWARVRKGLIDAHTAPSTAREFKPYKNLQRTYGKRRKMTSEEIGNAMVDDQGRPLQPNTDEYSQKKAWLERNGTVAISEELEDFGRQDSFKENTDSQIQGEVHGGEEYAGTESIMDEDTVFDPEVGTTDEKYLKEASTKDIKENVDIDFLPRSKTDSVYTQAYENPHMENLQVLEDKLSRLVEKLGLNSLSKKIMSDERAEYLAQAVANISQDPGAALTALANANSTGDIMNIIRASEVVASRQHKAIKLTTPEGKMEARVEASRRNEIELETLIKTGQLLRPLDIKGQEITQKITRINDYMAQTYAELTDIKSMADRHAFEINKLYDGGKHKNRAKIEELSIEQHILDEQIRKIRNSGIAEQRRDLTAELKEIRKKRDAIIKEGEESMAAKIADTTYVPKDTLELEKQLQADLNKPKETPKKKDGDDNTPPPPPPPKPPEPVVLTEEIVINLQQGVVQPTGNVKEIHKAVKKSTEEVAQEAADAIDAEMGKWERSGEEEIIEQGMATIGILDAVGKKLSRLTKDVASHFMTSELSTLKFFGGRITEVGRGFGGQVKRAFTGSLIRDGAYRDSIQKIVPQYVNLVEQFAKDQGEGVVGKTQAQQRSGADSPIVKQFNREVWKAIEYRRQGKPMPDGMNKNVLEFLDQWEKYMGHNHDMLVEAGIAGFRPGNKIDHYIPHIWKAANLRSAIRKHGEAKVEELFSQSYLKSNRNDIDTKAKADKAAKDQLKWILKQDGENLELDQYLPAVDSRGMARKDLDTTHEVDGLSIMDMLDDDVIGVGMKYSNRMAGWVGLSKATGGALNNEVALQTFRSSIEAEGKQKNINTRKYLQWYDDVIDQMFGRPTRTFTQGSWADKLASKLSGSGRGQDGVHKGLPTELRQLKDLTALTRMGGLGTAQLIESGQVISRAMLNLFSDPAVIKAVFDTAGEDVNNPTLMKEIMSISGITDDIEWFDRQSVHLDQQELEEVNAARQLSLWIADKGTAGSWKAEASRILGKTSGYNMVRKYQSRLTQASFMLDVAKHFNNGTGKMSKQRLTDLGLTDIDGVDIELETAFKQHAEFDADGNLITLNADKWDKQTRDRLQLAMLRDDAQQIQRTHIGELPPWMNRPLMGLIMQFRQMPIVANNKQLGRSMAFADKEAVMGLMLNAAMAGSVRYAKFSVLGAGVDSIRGAEWSEPYGGDVEKWAGDSSKYIAQFGIFSDIYDLVLGQNQVKTDSVGSFVDSVVDQFPAAGVAEDYVQAGKAVAQADASEFVDAAHGLTPEGNTWYGDFLFTWIGKMVDSMSKNAKALTAVGGMGFAGASMAQQQPPQNDPNAVAPPVPTAPTAAPQLPAAGSGSPVTAPATPTPTSTQTSAEKYSLTYDNEVGTGKYDSKVLHHPSSASGITIGAGYDMRDRTEADVKKDLIAAGIDTKTAAAMAKGAGLTGAAADTFVTNNSTLKITEAQQKKLFDTTVKKYEKRAKTQYKDLVTKYGKDSKYGLTNKEIPDFKDLPDDVKKLLVDYAYNVGVSEFPSFFAAVLKGDKAEAEKQYIRKAKDSAGVLQPIKGRNTATKTFMDAMTWKDLTKDKPKKP